jgi:hypothetical protein
VLKGIVIPVITPFDDGGAVDESTLRKLVDFYLRSSVQGLFALGSSGQGPAMSAGEMRKREQPKQELKPYDKRPLMAFRGNIRKEDIVMQGTQKLLGERKQHLGTSDRGVIMLRKMVRQAMQDVAGGKDPKGLYLKEDKQGLVSIDSFGVRATG